MTEARYVAESGEGYVDKGHTSRHGQISMSRPVSSLRFRRGASAHPRPARPSECWSCRNRFMADPVNQARILHIARTEGQAAARHDLDERMSDQHMELCL